MDELIHWFDGLPLRLAEELHPHTEADGWMFWVERMGGLLAFTEWELNQMRFQPGVDGYELVY